MSNQAEHAINISSDYRSLLLELTIAYLIKQPPDCIDFALDFFHEKKNERYADAQAIVNDEDEETTEESRRKYTFYGTSIHPEDENEHNISIYPKSNETKKKLIRYVKKIFFFRYLDDSQVERVLDAMQKWNVDLGTTVMKQGEEGDHFYIVEKGEFLAYVESGDKKKVLRVYDDEGCFGELSLIYNEPRSFTVKATTDGELWTLDRESFRKIIVIKAYKKRNLLNSLILKVDFFKCLTEEERMAVIDILVPRVFKAGQKIFNQGEHSDGMYFIEEGDVEFTTRDNLGDICLTTTLSSGDYFGEQAMLMYCPRASTATAVNKVCTVFLEVDAFERLLGPCLQLVRRDSNVYKQQMLEVSISGIRSSRDIRQ